MRDSEEPLKAKAPDKETKDSSGDGKDAIERRFRNRGQGSLCRAFPEAITEEAAVTKIEATAEKKAESSAKKKAKKLAEEKQAQPNAVEDETVA